MTVAETSCNLELHDNALRICFGNTGMIQHTPFRVQVSQERSRQKLLNTVSIVTKPLTMQSFSLLCSTVFSALRRQDFR
jgi:hypothetical protein